MLRFEFESGSFQTADSTFRFEIVVVHHGQARQQCARLLVISRNFPHTTR